MKDKKDKQCRFIFTATLTHITKGANISGGHCIYIYIYIYIYRYIYIDIDMILSKSTTEKVPNTM